MTLGERGVVDEAAGVVAVAAGAPARSGVLERRARRRARRSSRGVADGVERGDQHPVLVDVVGPRRRLRRRRGRRRRSSTPGPTWSRSTAPARGARRCSARSGSAATWPATASCAGMAVEQAARPRAEVAMAVPTICGQPLGGQADEGGHGADHVERARQPVPDLSRGSSNWSAVGRSYCTWDVDAGIGGGARSRGRSRARSCRGHPQVRRRARRRAPRVIVRWASACSGGSRSWATVRYRVVARRSSMPSNWGRK